MLRDTTFNDVSHLDAFDDARADFFDFHSGLIKRLF